jgi:hypothetical protein
VDSVLWYIVPLGIAAALSVFPILAVVLLLLSPNPIPAGVGYLAGWSAGVLVLVTLFSLGARLIPPSTTDRMPPWAHIVELTLGVLLVVVGIWRTIAARRRPAPTSPPSWTKAMDHIGPRRAFAFGLAMNVRPKNLAIALAAGLAIGSASLSIAGSSLTVLIFTAVAISTVAALVLAYVIGSHSVRPRLERFSDWLVANSSLVLNLSVALIGALLVIIGIANLL